MFSKTLAILGLCGAACVANAATWVDALDLNRLVASGSPYTYTHNLTDDGFGPSVDQVTQLTLQLTFRDDAQSAVDAPLGSVADDFESALIDPEGSQNSFSSGEIGANTLAFRTWSLFNPSVPGWATYSFAQDGYFSVDVSSQDGDFILVSSKLTAVGLGSSGDGGTGSNPVPEPGALWLMALGLAGLGMTRRRKLN